MKYTEQGERVTLEMTREDFGLLMMAVGHAAIAARRFGAMDRFRRWIQFANDLNTGNPNFTPYELPVGSDKEKP